MPLTACAILSFQLQKFTNIITQHSDMQILILAYHDLGIDHSIYVFFKFLRGCKNAHKIANKFLF